jgi:TonB family protein
MKIVLRTLVTTMLLGSTILLAQNAPENASGNLQKPAPDQDSERTHPIVEILSDAKGVDLIPYITIVAHAARQNWRTLTADSSRFGVTEPTQVGVEFTIQKDGTVTGVKLSKGSGHAELDQAAQDAIVNSSPLPALPENYPDGHLDLRIRFHRRSIREAEGNCGGSPGGPTDSGNNTGKTTDCPPMEENGIYRTGRGVSAPKPIYQPSPEYGKKSLKAKLEGSVLLDVVVTAEGTTRDVAVKKGLSPDLDQKAVEAVSKWKFAPAMKDGQPVAVRLVVMVDFHLY